MASEQARGLLLAEGWRIYGHFSLSQMFHAGAVVKRRTPAPCRPSALLPIAAWRASASAYQRLLRL